MVAAIVSLALGLYQSLRPGATNKIEWVQGVAILVAVVVISIVQALNDYEQERKFMTLNAKVLPEICILMLRKKTATSRLYEVRELVSSVFTMCLLVM
jgi:P-type Ca2+ transporter type 2C